MTSPNVTKNGHWEVGGVGGLLLGTQTIFPISRVTGLGQAPIKVIDEDAPGFDGGYAGDDLLQPREVRLSVGLNEDANSTELGAAIDQLGETFQPVSQAIQFEYRRFGRNRVFFARPRGVILPWDDDFHLGASKATVRVRAMNPVIFGADARTSASISASDTVDNDGNYPIWPAATFTATATTGSLQNLNDDGLTMALAGMTIGRTYVFDFRQRAIEELGGGNQYAILSGAPNWWQLRPGSNTVVVTGGTVFLEYRDGYSTG